MKNLYAYDDKGKERYNGDIHFEGFTSKEIEEILDRADYNKLEARNNNSCSVT